MADYTSDYTGVEIDAALTTVIDDIDDIKVIYGSNSYGSWVKFGDGTMISQTIKLTLGMSDNEWDYRVMPIAFDDLATAELAVDRETVALGGDNPTEVSDRLHEMYACINAGNVGIRYTGTRTGSYYFYARVVMTGRWKA